MRAVKRGRRYFAVPKILGIADRIHGRNVLPSAWERIMRAHLSARVIVNAKRQ